MSSERLRAVVVDDEPLAVDRLARLLDGTGRVEVVGRFMDSHHAAAAIRADARLDVLFLDIQMPGLTGFDLLEELDRDIPVIFTTAYDQYAIDAFAVNSIDYLLKPVEAERLTRALDKLERLAGQPRVDVRALARELASQLSHGVRLDRIASRLGERTLLLDVGRIAYFASREKLTFAVIDGREHVVDYSLSQLEERLDPRKFIRIHRSTIVNVTFARELSAGVDSGAILRLRDDAKTELSVARDRLRRLKERLGI